MELNNFVKNFTDLFDDIDADKINEGTDFKALDEWSSLMALSVIAMTEEEYDVALRGDDIRNAVTVGDLYEILKSRKSNQ